MNPAIANHPCFNESARHDYGRIHLPVARKCNIQCNYCNRLYDCVNESRPGVTSAVLTPQQAMEYLAKAVARDSRLAVVGIAGPGDPFAEPENTLNTLRLVRRAYPEMLLCVSSNGLNVAPYVEQLAALKVSHVTLTINAVDPAIGEKVYGWVRDGKRVLRGRAAAEALLARQLEALDLLKDRDIIVKVNTIVIPGVNEEHAAEVAREVAARGADLLNCIPMVPVEGTPLAPLGEPGDDVLAAVRLAAEEHLPQMRHCTRCRADAAGLLGEPLSEANAADLTAASRSFPPPDPRRPYVAVASMEGLLVNQHLGRAESLMIFAPAADGLGYEHVEDRPCPHPGGAEQRWTALAETLSDCRALLVSAAGQSPREVLSRSGIVVHEVEGIIDGALEAVYAGRAMCPSRAGGCGSGCPGSGLGCG